ncbi:MAG: DEAD/DEAH box helicase [Caulobacteraceae bacterium]|nr:DEAD/DEAH box helicase [Caulobacter sp.]
MPPSRLPPALARALEQRGYAELTPVQVAATQPETAGRDLLVSARTGSGKTVAYGLALGADILGEEATLPPADAPLALVIAPTRELALQVQRELEWLYAQAGARVVACVGGMDPRREQRLLHAGAHVVVGTPGRLRDHLERGALRMDALGAVVLDEADEMLDLGFREELEAILDAAPAERRTLLFSATLPAPIVAMAARFQRGALRISVGGGGERHADIDYRAVVIAPSDVEHAVVNLLRFHEAGAALVFCNTREAVRRLHTSLVERGFSVVALSGEMTQSERNRALQALRDGRTRVCVATDVAARGIDIPDLELVIHAELPTGMEALQHRSGRTGRAGRKGVSAMLVPYPRRRRAEALMRTARIEASWGPAPSAEEIRMRDQERLVAELRPAGEPADDDLVVARALLAEAAPETVVASLVRGRRAALPAPEDLVDSAPPAGSPEPGARAAKAPPRPGFEDTQWFSINLGRRKNAEARWLLPLICRRGHLTKADVGAIRVLERDTRFEVVRSAVDRFEAALAAAEDDGIEIVRAQDASPPRHARDGRGPRRGTGADRKPTDRKGRTPRH